MRNVTASTRRTSRAPDHANATPARTGPNTDPTSRAPPRSAFTEGRSSSSTMRGTMRPTDADSGAPHVETRSTSTRIGTSPRVRTKAIAPTMTACAKNAVAKSRGGETRSAMAPASGDAIGGTAWANSSNPTAVATPVVACTWRIRAVVAMASPSGLTVWTNRRRTTAADRTAPPRRIRATLRAIRSRPGERCDTGVP